MQYLIKTITHDTGEVFKDVVKARENEMFTLVEAESEEQAERKVKAINNQIIATAIGGIVLIGIFASLFI